MAITTMCTKEAYEIGILTNPEDFTVITYDGNTCYMHTHHRGVVLATREMNGYDDSDFYALVWAGDHVEQVEYATTRFWTYPNNATVDAAPEVLEQYRAWCARLDALGRVKREAEAKAAEARKAAMKASSFGFGPASPESRSGLACGTRTVRLIGRQSEAVAASIRPIPARSQRAGRPALYREGASDFDPSP